MKKIKFDKLFFLGLFVLGSVFANQYVNFVRWHDPLEILWFCDMTAIILGVGLILRNKTMTTLALMMAMPAQFRWILDFFLEMLGGGAGRTAHLFTFGPRVFWLSVNLHSIVIPIALFGTWKLGFAKKALMPILIYGFVLLTVTFLFTSPEENRNCVFYACDITDPGGDYLRYFLIKNLLFWEVVFAGSFLIGKRAVVFFEEKKIQETKTKQELALKRNE